jgi:hypothetical protein
VLNFIGTIIGPHHPLQHGFCNFSHAQLGQLLPMSGKQTVGVGGMRISVGRMVDPTEGPVCQTALGDHLSSYCSFEGAAQPQPASAKAESRL